MLKRDWALIWLVYLALAEVLSLVSVPDLSLCLIQPENIAQSSNLNENKYCPAFHSGVALVVEKTDHWLERHDKSVIGAFTIVLAISTIGLWLATNKLWKAGERQLELIRSSSEAQSRDMQDSIAAARRSADAALAGLQLAEVTSERQLRAYVSPHELTVINIEIGGHPSAHIVFKNTGQTPALETTVWTGIVLAEYPLRRTLRTATDDFMVTATRRTVGPGATFTAIPELGEAFTEVHRQLIFARQAAIYVWGEVRYRDFFGKERKTSFRNYYGGDMGLRADGATVGSETGNDAD